MWGGTAARNMVHPTAEGLPRTWDLASGENVKWSARLGSNAYGNPVVAGGLIFVGTNNEAPRDPAIEGDRGVLMCFRAEDGEFLWQDTYEKLPGGDGVDWPLQGICSSPAVDGERVYYVTNRGQVVCATTAGRDGRADVVWRFDMIAELGVQPRFMATSNPLVVADRVYVVTSNGTDESGDVPFPAAPSFLALDKRTGKIVWHEGSMAGTGHGVRMEKILEGQWGSPALAEVRREDGSVDPQILFPGGDGWLYALDPESGALVWKFDCNPKEAEWRPRGSGDRNYLIATPVFVDNRVYIGTGQDPEHGGGPGGFYAIDATGRGDVTESHAVWHLGGEEFGRTISTAAVHEGIVYVADLDGFLYAIDADSGEMLWQHDVLAAVWGSPLIADGHVHLADEDGDVTVLRTGRELEVVAENLLDDASYGTPVVVGKTIFLATRSRLYAFEEGASAGE